MMNVFKGNYLPWRRPTAWLSNICSFFRRFKWAWQRATRGFADCDIWNLDNTILNYLSGTLKYLADNHWGWPGDEHFPTDEDWTQFLRDMSQKFYQANECNDFYPTPKEYEWWEWSKEQVRKWEEENINGIKLYKYLPDDNPFREDMLKEKRENDLKREHDFAEAWAAIGEVFWDLWD